MKIVAILCVFLAVSGALFAQNENAINRVNTLIKANLNKNYDTIQQEAAELDEVDRLSIYTRNKMDLTGGFVNIFGPLIVGYMGNFGVGNFIQKDYLWGGITLGGNLVGVGVVIGGIAMLLTRGLTASSPDLTTPFTVMGVGAGITVASSLVGSIRAFAYPSIYNDKLKKALSVEHMVMNIEPSVDFNGQGISLTFATLHF